MDLFPNTTRKVRLCFSDVAWLGLTLALLLPVPTQASEESGFYVIGGLGATAFIPTVYDGTWYQQIFPHKFDTWAPAWKAGAGYRFNERWSVQAAYVALGSSGVTAEFVLDEDYDQINHVCLKNCSNRRTLIASDAMRAYELTVTRTWRWGPLAPFIRAGPALMTHRLTVNLVNSRSKAQQLYGRIPTAVVGGGLCYEWLCAEATYYHGLGGMDCLTHCEWPIAKRAVVPMLTVNVPLNW